MPADDSVRSAGYVSSPYNNAARGSPTSSVVPVRQQASAITPVLLLSRLRAEIGAARFASRSAVSLLQDLRFVLNSKQPHDHLRRRTGRRRARRRHCRPERRNRGRLAAVRRPARFANDRYQRWVRASLRRLQVRAQHAGPPDSQVAAAHPRRSARCQGNRPGRPADGRSHHVPEDQADARGSRKLVGDASHGNGVAENFRQCDPLARRQRGRLEQGRDGDRERVEAGSEQSKSQAGARHHAIDDRRRQVPRRPGQHDGPAAGEPAGRAALRPGERLDRGQRTRPQRERSSHRAHDPRCVSPGCRRAHPVAEAHARSSWPDRSRHCGARDRVADVPRWLDLLRRGCAGRNPRGGSDRRISESAFRVGAQCRQMVRRRRRTVWTRADFGEAAPHAVESVHPCEARHRPRSRGAAARLAAGAELLRLASACDLRSASRQGREERSHSRRERRCARSGGRSPAGALQQPLESRRTRRQAARRARAPARLSIKPTPTSS